MRRMAFVLVALVLLVPVPGRAEIYQWTDAEGRVHFTQDLTQVPPRHRAEAAEGAARHEETPRVQRIESSSLPAKVAPRKAGRGGGRAYEVPVERAGTSMRVVATLNGQVQAPFIIDTGASDVLIPKWVADELGIEVTDRTRTQLYQTANGIVEQPVVMLESVELGEARAQGVPASISGNMPVGLLGLSFFNRFEYQIDPSRGIVTLRPNDLTETGVIRGGRSESDWRAEFHSLRVRAALVEARMARLSPAHSRQLEELEQDRRKIDEQIEELEIEADRARVPHSWRQ